MNRVFNKHSCEINKKFSLNNTDLSYGKSETILNENCKNKIAVLELSTRAIKLLIGDIEKLKKYGFSFDAFPIRKSKLVNIGQAIDCNNFMNLNFLETSVIPKIRFFINFARENNVTKLYCVATAAYRSSRNYKDILDLIKLKTGINIKIISKKEEVQASIDAFTFSSLNFYEKYNNILLLDQGGGSTEISILKNNIPLICESLDIGTLSLINRLFLINRNLDIYTALKIIDNDVKKEINNKINLKNNYCLMCVAVGTSITLATNKKGNKNQHGTVLGYDDILNKINDAEKILINKYCKLENLYIEFNEYNNEVIENLLILRLGLYTYKYIMQKFGIKKIIVNGAGLWYGIYYKNFKDLKN